MHAPTKMILEKEYIMSIDVNDILTRILNKSIDDMEVTVKKNLRQQCVALLSYQYQIRQRVLDWLHTKDGLEIKSAQDFINK